MTSHYLGDDPAAAELWDFAVLGSGYAALTGFLHSLALLDTNGVPPSRFVPLVAQWLHGMTEYMPELAREIESGDYSAGVSPVGMNQVAVESLARVSEHLGIDADVLGPLRALLERGVAQGHADGVSQACSSSCGGVRRSSRATMSAWPAPGRGDSGWPGAATHGDMDECCDVPA
ncbi:hypothetical protein [Frankia sp. QA3]|uniref:imine reductase family protein n=1 Tax=Frankia sp. QA3 TaxID=710111 RepID=UPI000269BADC|nr:hypothetical protein [Frankia sp. QA3]EIV91063.1 hypothetical protein FraQA3DRAFT_0488 [Frankia sp. QA3]